MNERIFYIPYNTLLGYQVTATSQSDEGW